MHPYLQCSFSFRSKATRADEAVVGVEAAVGVRLRAADCRKAEGVLSYAFFMSGHLRSAIAQSGLEGKKEM